MIPAIIAYPHSQNLGDWIQSLIITYVWHQEFMECDREQLDGYRGSKVKLICNGWFLENPQKWPPSNDITPLFISFHITPKAIKELTKPESIAYFKKFEPIGCRDFHTRDLLHQYGVKSYFSGCITLAYEKQFFKLENVPSSGIVVASALDRLKPTIHPRKNAISFVLEVMKLPLKFWKYQWAVKRLNQKLKKIDKPIIKLSQIISIKRLKTENPKQLAMDYLKKIAHAELVITSRIHTALPAVAMNIPVLFLDDGLTHINHKSRLEGLDDFFHICSSHHLNQTDFSTITTKTNHLKIKESLKETINLFLTDFN
ncbi:MAG: polysaccharide pyruvyl transferase family protein [Flavobacteriaceae bacterium]|nr:polysaccharide pyruvyl transferase family protein [Flavobacteriaceae bacterium]MCY4267215.1 polysaccharide pyruvyl transferase family protein [Flavobacteriaceae bacterium]MCY4298169.1 polysaccharide pyruvyl transferase family protein [Flavobacteriaceae bacterium]